MPSQYTNLEKIRLEKAASGCARRGSSHTHTRAERTHTSQEAIQAFEQAEAARDPEPLRCHPGGADPLHAPDGQDHLRPYRRWLGRIQLFLRANDVGEETAGSVQPRVRPG